MQERSSPHIHDLFETEAEMIRMQGQVTDAQNEVDRVKQQLRDAETKLERAESSRQFCLKKAAEHKQQYDARLEEMTVESSAAQKHHANQVSENTELKKKLQVMEAQNAKDEEHEKLLVARINSSNHVARVLKLQLDAALSAAKSDVQGSRRKRTHDEYVVAKLKYDTAFTDYRALRIETAKNARPLTKKAKVSSTTQSLPEGSDT
jgi:chromosome segregation ATPase